MHEIIQHIIQRAVFKTIETESLFTNREMENEWHVSFLQNTWRSGKQKWIKRSSSKYVLFSISIEPDAVFIKKAMNNE